MAIVMAGLAAFFNPSATAAESAAEPHPYITHRNIVYSTVEGRNLRLDLYVPGSHDENDSRKWPLIIWVHGGAWMVGSKDKPGVALNLLNRGYAVASVEYRLSGEAVFPAAFEDCKAAVSFLRLNAGRYGLDPDRFGAWGESAGGHLVSMLGTTGDIDDFDTHPVCRIASSKVQAVCNWYGPSDFLRMNDIPGRIDHNAADSPESRFIGGPIVRNPELVKRANPISYVSDSDPPFLHMHGKVDLSVPVNQSELLHDALRRAGVESELILIENGDHGFRGADVSREQLAIRVGDFFDRVLKTVDQEEEARGTVRRQRQGSKPNILFISIDDLNDWVGCLNGHPQAMTPNIDRLAESGVLFTNAHCQAPVCTASRASLMTSRYPSSTGLYFLQPGLRSSPVLENAVTFAEHFALNGYRTMGAGKVYHQKESSYFHEYGGAMGGFGPFPRKPLNYDVEGVSRLWDWGAFPAKDEDTPDHKLANWAAGQLQKDYEKPFFLAVGFWRPHVPMYAPPGWFDIHPLNSVILPEVIEGDREDLSGYAKCLTAGVLPPTHDWIKENNQWKRAVQAYLASISFVDHQIGRLLDALAESRHAGNTIIVLFSDHGWHLGEKGRWAKRSLWGESTRVPMITAGSGIKSRGVCDKPVGLIDILPTVSELAGLPGRAEWEGLSLVPLLDDCNAAWSRPIICSLGPGNHAVCDELWRYIRYHDGSEELYDRLNDPHEWHNVISGKGHTDIVARLRKSIPETDHRPWTNPGSRTIKPWVDAEKLIAPAK